MAAVASSYNIEQVRKEWIGKKGPRTHGRYPVEYDPIRRHCHMCGSTNPLFLDPEYAKTTKYGTVIAPAIMADNFAGNGPWPPTDRAAGEMLTPPTPGSRNINLNTSWEFLKPIKVGDRLSGQSEVEDIYEKPIRLDPRSVWIVTKRTIYNQDGDVVAIGRTTLCKHRTPEEVAADK